MKKILLAILTTSTLFANVKLTNDNIIGIWQIIPEQVIHFMSAVGNRFSIEIRKNHKIYRGNYEHYWEIKDGDTIYIKNKMKLNKKANAILGGYMKDRIVFTRRLNRKCYEVFINQIKCKMCSKTIIPFSEEEKKRKN